MKKALLFFAVTLLALSAYSQKWGEPGWVKIKAESFNPYGYNPKNFQGQYILAWTYDKSTLPPAGNWWYCKSIDGRFDRQLALPIFITAGDIIYIPEMGYLIAMHIEK